jgi:DNA-binding transcriptional LysR family regulator
VDLRFLRYFVACVEHRSLHSAAEALHISQPAISKAVHRLEEELGVPLLDRHPRGVEPTPYGQTLVRYAKMLETELRRAKTEIDAMRGATQGRILIGVAPTLLNDVLSDAIAEVMGKYRRLKIEMRIGLTADLQAAVLDGALDVAVMLVRSHTPLPEIVFEPLVSIAPVIVARADHPLAGKQNVPLAELRRFPWLMPQAPIEHRQMIHRAFIDAGLPPPEPAIEVNVAVFFAPLIARTDLLTVVPRELMTWQLASASLATIDTALSIGTETIGLAYRSNTTLLPGVQLLMEAVRRAFGTLPNAIGPAGGRAAKR